LVRRTSVWVFWTKRFPISTDCNAAPLLHACLKKDNLAIYFGDDGGGLQSWNHGGYHPAEMNKGEINTLIIHFNNGVSAGVIINSPYGAGSPGDFFGDLIASVKAAE
jgi:hypothetical protein